MCQEHCRVKKKEIPNIKMGCLILFAYGYSGSLIATMISHTEIWQQYGSYEGMHNT